MTQMSKVRNTKPDVYDAWRNGDISDDKARAFFGLEWNEVRQLSEVENILSSQPEPEVEDSELFYD